MEDGQLSDEDWGDYESGPFCVHWGDPFDCEIVCENCMHSCAQHGGGHSCGECSCTEFSPAR